MTGMALNLNGRWEKSQVAPELQEIVRKHRNYFEGESVISAAIVKGYENGLEVKIDA